MSIFSNIAAAVDVLKKDRLVLMAQSLGADISALDDEFLYGKLLAAEASVARELRTFLEPTVVIPDDAPQSEVDALEAAGTKYAQESAYDYNPEFFYGDSWGYIKTKHSPVISVQGISLHYPMPTPSIFNVPTDWIRVDRKYGHIRLVPGAMSFSAPLAALVFPSLGGGRMVPFMIQVRYTAGLKNAARDYPDLLDAIYKTASISLIEDMMMPASGSISADGLSQSMSTDVGKYRDMVDRLINGAPGTNGGLRTAIKGITLGFPGGA